MCVSPKANDVKYLSCDYLPSIYLFDHITVRVFCLLSNWVVWYFTIEGFLKSIYLAALGLSWGIQDLQSSLRHKGCFSWSIWTLSCNMWDLAPWSGIEPRPPALKAQTLSHRKTREVSVLNFESSLYIKDTSLLSNKHFADIFSQSLPCLLIFFTGSFSEQILKFWWSSIYQVFLIWKMLWCHVWEVFSCLEILKILFAVFFYKGIGI